MDPIDGRIIELEKGNWEIPYLSVAGTPYRIVRAKVNANPRARNLAFFRLERIENEQELLDALAWLLDHKHWRDVRFSSISSVIALRGKIYLVCKDRWSVYY